MRRNPPDVAGLLDALGIYDPDHAIGWATLTGVRAEMHRVLVGYDNPIETRLVLLAFDVLVATGGKVETPTIVRHPEYKEVFRDAILWYWNEYH